MNILQFLFGKNLNDSISFKPGTFYLDVAKKELWFDDPSNNVTNHTKIIDADTLLYKVTETIEWGGGDSSSSTTAKLGTATLGSMVLGTP